MDLPSDRPTSGSLRPNSNTPRTTRTMISIGPRLNRAKSEYMAKPHVVRLEQARAAPKLAALTFKYIKRKIDRTRQFALGEEVFQAAGWDTRTTQKVRFQSRERNSVPFNLNYRLAQKRKTRVLRKPVKREVSAWPASAPLPW